MLNITLLILQIQKKSYMSYSRKAQTICKKTNIFYPNDSAAKALLLDGNSIKRSCAIITDKVMPYEK